MRWRRQRRRPRVLATRFGLNPNSSSLGVDVTFLLVGATFLSIATPVVGALLRLRRQPTPHGKARDTKAPDSDVLEPVE